MNVGILVVDDGPTPPICFKGRLWGHKGNLGVCPVALATPRNLKVPSLGKGTRIRCLAAADETEQAGSKPVSR
jgi:hypothetical protein